MHIFFHLFGYSAQNIPLRTNFEAHSHAFCAATACQNRQNREKAPKVTRIRSGTTQESLRFDHQLTFCRFYPVAERSDSYTNPAGRDLARSNRNSQHGIWLHSKSAQRKNRTQNPIGLKFLRSRGFFQEAPCRVWDRVPRSSASPAKLFRAFRFRNNTFTFS